jgi:hypothetical protein
VGDRRAVGGLPGDPGAEACRHGLLPEAEGLVRELRQPRRPLGRVEPRPPQQQPTPTSRIMQRTW